MAIGIEGFPTLWHPDCARQAEVCRVAAAAAADDLRRVKREVPCSALRVVTTVRTVFSLGDPPQSGPPWGSGPRYYHAEAVWLVASGIGADRLGVVEIADTAAYVRRRAQKPAILLHELAHAYLDRTGERHAVETAFRQAQDSGRYDSVWKRDWTLEMGTAASYAMRSPDEYFADLSEAYFWTNEWYPFKRFQLVDFDPAGAEMVRRLWAPDGVEAPCGE
jgi:hypothetical protein